MPGWEVGYAKDGAAGHIQFRPGEWNGDWNASTGAWGKGRYGGGSALVAQVVEEDVVGAGGFAHFADVASGILLFYEEREAMGEAFHRGPVVFGDNGDDEW